MTELSITSIALIGFGEVGQMLAQEFVSRGDLRISAFDIAFVNQGSAQTAAAGGDRAARRSVPRGGGGRGTTRD